MPEPDACPFCGSTEIICIVPDHAFPRGYGQCRECKANGPEVARVAGDTNVSLFARTIAAWNRRLSPPAAKPATATAAELIAAIEDYGLCDIDDCE